MTTKTKLDSEIKELQEKLENLYEEKRIENFNECKQLSEHKIVKDIVNFFEIDLSKRSWTGNLKYNNIYGFGYYVEKYNIEINVDYDIKRIEIFNRKGDCPYKTYRFDDTSLSNILTDIYDDLMEEKEKISKNVDEILERLEADRKKWIAENETEDADKNLALLS